MSSIFSGSAGRKTALWKAGLAMDQLNSVIPMYEEGWGKARGALRSAYGGSAQWLKKGYKGFRRDIGQGMETARGDLTTGYGDAIKSVQEGYGQAIPLAQQGAEAWKGNLDRANVGYDMYSNALGLKGAQGRADAQAAFQAGPGYQWSVDQATSQAQRAANRTGAGVYGGNTLTGNIRLASNLANQEWNNWLGNLQNYQGAAGTATQGYAGQLNNVAELYAGRGKDVGELQAGQGKDLAQNAQWGYGTLGQGAYNYGSDRASLLTNYGNSMANAATGRMNDITGAVNNYWNTVSQAGEQGMQAGQNAAANRFGAMTGFLNMGMQGLGMLGGGGGGIFGRFMGR